MDIKIQVLGQKAKITNRHELYSGTVAIEGIQFEFSDEWADMTKTATVYVGAYDRDKAVNILIENDRVAPVQLPPELFEINCELYVGVFGIDADGRRLTSSIVRQEVKKGVPVQNASDNVSIDVYTRIIQLMTEAKDIAADSDERIASNKIYLDQATEQAEKSKQYAESAEGHLANVETVAGNVSEMQKAIEELKTAAEQSASDASTSELNASQSEQNALASELNAKKSEQNASKSATDASTSASNAKKSETAAATSEQNARQITEQLTEDVSQLKEDLITIENSKVTEDEQYTIVETWDSVNNVDGYNRELISISGYGQTFSNGYGSYRMDVNAGDKYRIIGSGVNSNFPEIIFTKKIDSGIHTVIDTFNPTNKEEDYVFSVPDGCNYLIINQSFNKKATIYTVSYGGFRQRVKQIEENTNNALETIDIFSKSADLQEFELSNLERRCLKSERNNEFRWGKFDKAYFVFVIDDCGYPTYTMYQLFHEKGLPLSSAAIPGRLNEAVPEVGHMKDVLNLIVTDGGEILAHYYGNLVDIGKEVSGNYLNTREDWNRLIRDTKIELEKNGFEIRGVIRADLTAKETITGEEYCKKYFDYSDGLGKSIQYKQGRTFLMNFDTVDSFKAWIDKCCKTPGFYPICTHGTESLNEHMGEILDYITAKGSDVCTCSTYKDVFDSFASNNLEERIKAIEEKLNT